MMNAVSKIEEQSTTLANVRDMAGELMEIIAKAARDPSVDVDKMERLLLMQERVQARDAESQFNVAMAKAQSEMRPVSADADNLQTKSRYASYAQLDRALRPIYAANGFALSFDEGESPKAEHVRILCYVSHVAGHTRTYHRDMPADGKGAKGGDVMTKTHAAGAAGSYGARYLLKGIFNVAVGEDDNDGNDVAEYIDERQIKTINDMIGEHDLDTQKFCNYMGVPNVPALLARDYRAAIEAINATISARKTRANAEAAK
jgi:ERF superfamily